MALSRVALYVGHYEGRRLSTMQALKLIPFEHVDTCKGYMDAARLLGWLDVEDDPHDGRRRNVIPTPKLLTFVEACASKALHNASRILNQEFSA